MVHVSNVCFLTSQEIEIVSSLLVGKIELILSMIIPDINKISLNDDLIAKIIENSYKYWNADLNRDIPKYMFLEDPESYIMAYVVNNSELIRGLINEILD